MKLRAFLWAAGAAMAVAVAGSASAGIVYQSTPALNGGGGYWCSDCFGGSGFQTLDPFTLGSSQNITGVNVVTLADVGFHGLTPFTVFVYTDSSNPASVIFSQAVTPTYVSNANDANGYNYDVVHADLSGLSLTGGQQYWISFLGEHLAIGDSAGNNNGALVWNPPGSGAIYAYTHDNLEYALFGGVPEPATWAMLILGVAMVGFAARRRNAGVAAAA